MKPVSELGTCVLLNEVQLPKTSVFSTRSFTYQAVKSGVSPFGRPEKPSFQAPTCLVLDQQWLESCTAGGKIDEVICVVGRALVLSPRNGGGDFLGDEFIGKNGNLRAYGLNMKKQGKSFLVGFFLGFLVGFPSFVNPSKFFYKVGCFFWEKIAGETRSLAPLKLWLLPRKPTT